MIKFLLNPYTITISTGSACFILGRILDVGFITTLLVYFAVVLTIFGARGMLWKQEKQENELERDATTR